MQILQTRSLRLAEDFSRHNIRLNNGFSRIRDHGVVHTTCGRLGGDYGQLKVRLQYGFSRTSEKRRHLYNSCLTPA
jgi:hypothetical protein